MAEDKCMAARRANTYLKNIRFGHFDQYSKLSGKMRYLSMFMSSWRRKHFNYNQNRKKWVKK